MTADQLSIGDYVLIEFGYGTTYGKVIANNFKNVAIRLQNGKILTSNSTDLEQRKCMKYRPSFLTRLFWF